jgi:hypothetical protein
MGWDVMVGAPGTGTTVTVVVAVLLPDPLVAVSVKIVVAAGVTDVLVPVTVPTPWSMLRLVAPVTAQASMLLWPVVMLVGLAVKLVMVGAVGGGVLSPPPPPPQARARARAPKTTDSKNLGRIRIHGLLVDLFIQFMWGVVTILHPPATPSEFDKQCSLPIDTPW